MPGIFTLQVGSTTQSLAAWGISAAQIERINLATETLRITIPQVTPYADPVFVYEDVGILRLDGAVIWAGRVSAIVCTVEGLKGRHQYVFANAWAQLESIIYQQQYVIYDAEATAKLGSWSSRVVLGQNQFGIKITADEQINQIGAYANIVGGGLVTFAEFGPYAVPPVETVRDITTAEGIRRMAAYTPDAVGAFSYGEEGATTLTIKQRSGLATVELDLADGDKVELVGDIQPLHRLQPRGVVLVFLTSEEVEEVGTVLRETRQTAGTITGPRVLFATIELAQGEAVPDGLATQYYNALSTLQWAGALRLHERWCTGSVRPGHKVNLANGQAAWATMAAVVQSTVEDLIAGTTEVTLGAPEHLGLSDFVDMMRRFRERNAGGAFANTQHNGTSGVAGQAEGTDPSPDEENPAGEDHDAGGAVGGTGDPEDQEGNDASGSPPPGVSTYVTARYCDITVPEAPVTRTARFLAIPVSPPA